jgi:outer membrane protein OmpA-like peptidoglycan-associated protein
MRRWVRVLPVALVAAVAVSGCATKKFVREELQKSEAKTATEVGRIDQSLAQSDTKVSGVAAQVVEVRTATEAAAKSAQEAGVKAVEADGKAVQAANRAEAADMRAGQAMGKAEEAGTMANQAMTKATETDQRLTRLWKDRNNRTLGDTVVIQFGFDKFQLDDKGQTALLEVVRALEQNPGAIVDLEGYTDNAGDSGYNVQLSQRRADAVRRFLVDKGVALHRIQSLGLGDARPVAANNNRQGREQNRRVAVKMYTPSGD